MKLYFPVKGASREPTRKGRRTFPSDPSVRANRIMRSILLLAVLLLPMRSYALDVGDRTPEFHVVTLDGKEISYDRDLRNRKPVYLIFWTTW